MPQRKALGEQVIVITGASSGIGLLTARSAAAAGARVFLIARNRKALARISAEIGEQADFAVADVGDRLQVQAVANAAVARFGRIDTWVNNAGVAIYADLLDTPEDEHRRLFQTNYFGTVHGAEAAVPYLRASGGTLITVGSIVSDLPSPIMGAYAASKHAAKGYVDSLRIELNAAKAGVAVVLVKPSGMATPVAKHAANHGPGAAKIPPPVYDPQLVANAILDMAVRPRREITVGGIGALEALIGAHFPGLLARFGGLLVPLLFDPSRSDPARDNLAAPAALDQPHAPDEAGRRTSMLSLAQRHRGVLAVGAAAALLALATRRRQAA